MRIYSVFGLVNAPDYSPARSNHFFHNFETMDIQNIISVDNDILGGQPVFAGTRVPVESLFDHLESGVSLEAFLDDFPTVSKEQAVALLEVANKMINAKNIVQLYEAVA